jgi:hypothetical protein
VIVESSAFLFRDSVLPPTYLFGKLFFPSVVTDVAAMEEIFQGSQPDWTLSGLLSLPTNLAQANTVFKKVIFPDSDSRFPGPMWRTVS